MDEEKGEAEEELRPPEVQGTPPTHQRPVATATTDMERTLGGTPDMPMGQQMCAKNMKVRQAWK